jgi:hypothetical protein
VARLLGGRFVTLADQAAERLEDLVERHVVGACHGVPHDPKSWANPPQAAAWRARKRVCSAAVRSLRRSCLFAIALAAPLGACQPKIGDACRRSTDCSITGDRTCDLSVRVNSAGVASPGGSGECIIEGCGRGDCPKEGACVKVYASDFLSVACTPEREDTATQAGPPLDDCLPHEVCLLEGLCADEITARTSCRRECENNGDCRAGYECFRTGARGIYRAPDLENPANDTETRICIPIAQ